MKWLWWWAWGGSEALTLLYFEAVRVLPIMQQLLLLFRLMPRLGHGELYI